MGYQSVEVPEEAREIWRLGQEVADCARNPVHLTRAKQVEARAKEPGLQAVPEQVRC